MLSLPILSRTVGYSLHLRRSSTLTRPLALEQLEDRTLLASNVLLDLGELPVGVIERTAYSVSADGSVIVGD